MTEPTTEALTKLREKFPQEAVGKLPRSTCKACSERNCQQHSKSKCNECGNYMTTAHIHLDYVGHAEVTDRLLTVDPLWTWEPVAFGPDGTPVMDRNAKGQPIGMWIRLTVCGVTRLGYGSVESGKFDAEKQLIGDALRNAAMRFGVALDLWSKAELESFLTEEAAPDRAPVRKEEPTRTEEEPPNGRSADHDSAAGGGTNEPAPTASAGPCSLCGSTRSLTVEVRGVVRCAIAKECKRRQDEKSAAAA